MLDYTFGDIETFMRNIKELLSTAKLQVDSPTYDAIKVEAEKFSNVVWEEGRQAGFEGNEGSGI